MVFTSAIVYNEEPIHCKNVAKGKIEGLDMQPNGFLLVGVDYGKQKATSILAYNWGVKFVLISPSLFHQIFVPSSVKPSRFWKP